MSDHRRKGRPCKFEPLEQRNLLAGDVTASIHNGDLVIKGDDLANGITITAGATAGTVVIKGVSGGSATNVADITNGPATGTPNGTITLTGFTGDLKIKMKDGDDTVSITDLTVPDDVEFEGGEGNDTLTIDGGTIGDSLKVNLGEGDDTLTIDDTTVADDAKIKTKRGEDDATITDSTFDELKVKMGKDDDHLAISGTTVHDETRLNGKKGTNILTQGAGNSLSDLTIKHFQSNSASTTVDLNSVTAITEGSSATLTGSFTDADLTETRTLTTDWGDPNNIVDSTFAVPASSGLAVNQTINSSTDSAVLKITAINSTTGQVTFSVQHKYADDGVSPSNNTASDTNTITVTVKYANSLTASDTTTVTVNNAAPTVALNAVTAISENNTATLTGSFTDIGLSDVHTMTVNWGDPNNATNSTFTFAATSGLSVNQTINATSADASVLTITAINTTTGQVSFSVQHKYADDGVSPGNTTTSDNSTITVTVADDDTGSGNSTTTVTVNNAAPTVALNAVTAISENNTATLTGGFTDVGISDPHTVTVNWGDANTTTNSTFTVPVISGLSAGQTINSTTDSAVLTITAINATTGQVTFSVQHKYLDDGVSPGNTTTSDNSTITVTVTDDDGQNGSNTTTVSVNNVAPTVTLNSVSAINENSTATLTGSYTDIGLSDAHTVTVNWGDSNNATNSTFAVPATSGLAVNQTVNSTSGDGAVLTITAITAATGQVSFSVQHKYADDGAAPGNNSDSDTNTITVTVADDDGQNGSNTTTVTVNNVAPDVGLNSVSAINENGTATLTGSFTDIGLSDVHTLTVNWGDANNGINSTFTVPATSGLALNQTISASSADAATLTITAINAATGQVTFSVQHKYADDGLAAGNNTTSDSSTIKVTIADDDTGSTNTTTTVLVNNVAPTVALNAVPAINENGTATLTGSFTDIGLSDVHTMTVNWGDPRSATNSTFTVPVLSGLAVNQTITSSSGDGAVLTITAITAATGQVSFSVQHKYVDDGPFPNITTSDTSTITVTVADDDTSSGNNTTTVVVNNVAPTVALEAVTAINENGIATLKGSYTDIGLSDTHALTVEWGDPNNSEDSLFTIDSFNEPLSVGDTFDSLADDAVLTITALNAATGQVSFSVKHQYIDDGATAGNNTVSDTHTITVTVDDDDSGSDSETASVTVNNVAPTVALNAVSAINENGTATLTGSYTDIGIQDAHTLTVDWDDPNNGADSIFALGNNPSGTFNSVDGAVLTVISFNPSTGEVTFSVQHKYLDDGAVPGNNLVSDSSTITVTVADDDTSSGCDTSTVTINNVAPTVALTSVVGVSENGTATLLGSFTDIGLKDDHTLVVNWGDPNNSANSTFSIDDFLDPLQVNDTINSSTDTAVLTITALDSTTGQVSFSVQHKYVDDGPAPNNTESDLNTIAVTVTDDDNQSGSDSRFVTISNVTPSVALNSVVGVSENGTVTLTGSYTDIGLHDAHMLTVTWGDPNKSTNSTFSVGPTNGLVAQTINSLSGDNAVLTISAIDAVTGQVSFSVQHQYLDDGEALGNATDSDISTIAVTVTDDDGQSGSSTRFVTVSNVSPTVSLNSVSGISENGTASLSGSYTDIGLLDAHTLTVNWGDPNNDIDSTFAVGAIRNAAGVATLVAGGTVNSTTDTAVLTIIAIDATTGQVSFSVQHQYVDDGLAPGNDTDSDINTIAVTVADDDGQSGSSSRFVTIGNVAPEISDPGDDTINENSEVTIVAKITDPGPNDVFSVEVDWKEGTPDTIAGLGLTDIAETISGATKYSWNAAARQLTLKHTYVDDNPNGTNQDIYAVTLTPSDDDAGTGDVQTVNITVNNVVPSVALNAVAGTFSIPATLTGTFTDIGLQDEHTLTIDWDDPNNANNSVFADIGAVQTLSVDDTFTSSGADTTTTLRITSVNTTSGVVGFEVKHTYTSTGTRTIEVVAKDDDLDQSVAATATAIIVPGID